MKISCAISEYFLRWIFQLPATKILLEDSFKKLLMTLFVHKPKNGSPHLLVMNRVDIFCSDLDLYSTEKCVRGGVMNLFKISKYYFKESTWNLEVSKEIIIHVYCQNWAKLGVTQNDDC